MDRNGYPDEQELQEIASWPIPDWHGLMARVRELWSYPERFTVDGETYTLSTGGWSGNEDLIMAMQENRVFWALCWYQSTRGGLFVFKVPECCRADEPSGEREPTTKEEG